jgi:hypothetical protein NreA
MNNAEIDLLHHGHENVRQRLLKAEGHLRSIIAMITEERPCVEIAQQLQAVEKAVCQAKRTLIHDHIDHCLGHPESAPNQDNHLMVEEFRQIAKYL